MGCRDFAETYLKIINGIVLALSVVILGYSAYLAALLGEDLKQVGLNDPVLVSAIFGGALFVFSVIGIVGTVKDNKCLLLIYIIGSLVLALGILASGVALLYYGNYLRDVRDGDVNDKIQETIQNFELAAFQECCQGAVVNDCDPLAILQPCVTDREQFDEFVEFIDDGTCEALEDAGIVGDPLEGKCGGLIASAFIDDINNFFIDNLKILAAVNIALGVILLLLLATACTLVWTKDDDARK